MGKFFNDRKVTHFHSPFKLVQSKGRTIPLQLLAGVNEDLRRMETEGHILKLDEECDECDEECFFSPIVITTKKDGSIILALDSKSLHDQIFKNNYHMPNIHVLIDNVALQISEDPTGQVWFSNLDLKNAYSQFKLGKKTSEHAL